jgi:hypothetical protein
VEQGVAQLFCFSSLQSVRELAFSGGGVGWGSAALDMGGGGANGSKGACGGCVGVGVGAGAGWGGGVFYIPLQGVVRFWGYRGDHEGTIHRHRH